MLQSILPRIQTSYHRKQFYSSMLNGSTATDVEKAFFKKPQGALCKGIAGDLQSRCCPVGRSATMTERAQHTGTELPEQPALCAPSGSFTPWAQLQQLCVLRVMNLWIIRTKFQLEKDPKCAWRDTNANQKKITCRNNLWRLCDRFSLRVLVCQRLLQNDASSRASPPSDYCV